jgi:hypothetical protein
VWIERCKHPFHGRVNQVVVAGLAVIDVILAQELERFGEHGDLCVTAVVLGGGGVRGVKTHTQEDVEHDETDEGAE